MADNDCALQFVLKVVSRCNLNCSYCYVYNKADHTWRQRPSMMSDEIFAAAISRIRRYCLKSGQQNVRITFHGGEPCLAGTERFSEWCYHIHETLNDVVRVGLSFQTNGTLLDERWMEVLLAHEVDVGLSMDGPKDLHNVFRVDHRGRGSYDDVERGALLLQQTGIPLNILSVIQPGADGLAIHRHFLSLGVENINYLLPDYTHDTIAPVWEKYGLTPCADYLIPIFDDWWYNSTLLLKISIFWNIARLILGGNSEMDFLGNRPLAFLFVETDGTIEGLDVLRVCKEGMSQTGLNVLTHDFHQIAEVSELHRKTVFQGVPLPFTCQACPERTTCAGGYLPHRYSSVRGFDNSTVWCQDLLRLFAHIRAHLGVSVEETQLRRQVLDDMIREKSEKARSC
jgi:uncharacterized protein